MPTAWFESKVAEVWRGILVDFNAELGVKIIWEKLKNPRHRLGLHSVRSAEAMPMRPDQKRQDPVCG